MARGDWLKIRVTGVVRGVFRGGSWAAWRVLSGGNRGATGVSTVSTRVGVVLRGFWEGCEGVWGTLWRESGVVSVGNVEVCGGVSRGAVVESWSSSVHNVVVSGVFWGGSRVVWG